MIVKRVTADTDGEAGIGPYQFGIACTICNRGSVSVFLLAESDDAVGAGFELGAGESMGFELDRGDRVWLKTASSTAVVHLIAARVAH